MTPQKHFILLFISLALVLSSCQNRYKEVYDLIDSNWPQTQKLDFHWDATAGTSAKVTVRSLTDYSYCNIYLKAVLKDGSGKVIQEKLREVFLNNPNTGEPLGSGFGNTNSVTTMLWKKLPASKDGKYQLEIHQYMREKSLSGINSVGIEILP